MAQADELNIFMMCASLNRSALTTLPVGFTLRHPDRDELEVWKRFPFDNAAMADEYAGYMSDYFARVYAPHGELFFNTCLFVVNADDVPVGTCFAWKITGGFTTIHWLKVDKAHENLGIGRALLSAVMTGLSPGDFPVYLHTQVGSFRAIKLYSDFGFVILKDKVVGKRCNEFEQGLPHLRKVMRANDFDRLKFGYADREFLDTVAQHEHDEF